MASALPGKDQPQDDAGYKMVQAVDQAALRQLLISLPGLIGALQVEESADGVSIETIGQSATIAHLGLGMSANAPDGILQTKLDLALDGLAVPSLPLAFADLLPHHIALRPTISGVNLTSVLALVQQAADARQAPDTMAGQDVIGPQGLITSIDRLSIDVGPATLTGNGRVTMQDGATRGAATISVSGYDALTARLGKAPGLQQAMPILILAKGLARTDGAGVDVASEAGGVPETFTMATVIVRPGGHVANIGVHGTSVDLALNELWIKNIDISMGLVNTNTLAMLLKLVSEHKLPADKFVTHEFGFDQMLEAYDVFGHAAEHDALKVLIH